MENVVEKNVSFALKRFYDTATNNIKTSALVNRALADKISTETINQKVNNQLRAIYASMNRINPNFNETSKNYGIIKQDILDVLTDYELALTELSDFYDNQVEELILKKVELESDLVGKMFREEVLKIDENVKTKAREQDKLKGNFTNKAKKILNCISEKKQEKSEVDLMDIKRLQDLKDLEQEHNSCLDKKIEKIHEKNMLNQVEVAKIENEIQEISKKIKKINEDKQKLIENAMESREKWIAVTLKKPSAWSKAKSFFSNRFTTVKVISKTVIAPLKIKIREFRSKELERLRG